MTGWMVEGGGGLGVESVPPPSSELAFLLWGLSLQMETPFVLERQPREGRVACFLEKVQRVGGVWREGALSWQKEREGEKKLSYPMLREEPSLWWVLAPSLMRSGSLRVGLPVGGELSSSGWTALLGAWEKMGITAELYGGDLLLSCGRLCGAQIELRERSLAVAIPLLLSMLWIPERSLLLGVPSDDPLWVELLRALRAAGAGIEEEGGAVSIEGGRGLYGGAYALPVEREEAALFLCHAAARGQRMEIKGELWGLAPLLGSLREAGHFLEESEERTILYPCDPHRIGFLRLEGGGSEGAQTQRLQGLRLVWALHAAEEVEIAAGAIAPLCGLLGEMRKLGLRLQTRSDGALRCCARLPFFCADLEARDPRDAMALWLAAMLSEGRSYLTLQEKEKHLLLEIDRRGR